MMEEHLNTSDYIALMLKLALDHNAEILKVATIYFGTFNDMKASKKKELLREMKSFNKRYVRAVDDLVKEAVNIPTSEEGRS